MIVGKYTYITEKKPYVVMTQKGDLEFDDIEEARLCEKTHNGFLYSRQEKEERDKKLKFKRGWF